MKLFIEKPKRFFAFGCSFTSYMWPTWADFVALELGPEVQYYNFARSGAGNQYISNMIAQADAKFNFDKNDLVMVCWTNVCREDRMFVNDQNTPEWAVPGNLTTQHVYDKEWLDRFASCRDWFFIRDFASIHLTTGLLNKTNSHQLSMVDIHKTWDQYMSADNPDAEDNLGSLAFPASTQKILPSIYKILWDDKLGTKLKKDMKRIHPAYMDYHPTPDEHYLLLKKLFKKQKWSKTTDYTANIVSMEFISMMKSLYKKNKVKKMTTPYKILEKEGWDADIVNKLRDMETTYFVRTGARLYR